MKHVFLIELVVFYGIILGFAVWDLMRTRASLRKDKAMPAEAEPAHKTPQV